MWKTRHKNNDCCQKKNYYTNKLRIFCRKADDGNFVVFVYCNKRFAESLGKHQ